MQQHNAAAAGQHKPESTATTSDRKAVEPQAEPQVAGHDPSSSERAGSSTGFTSQVSQHHGGLAAKGSAATASRVLQVAGPADRQAVLQQLVPGFQPQPMTSTVTVGPSTVHSTGPRSATPEPGPQPRARRGGNVSSAKEEPTGQEPLAPDPGSDGDDKDRDSEDEENLTQLAARLAAARIEDAAREEVQVCDSWEWMVEGVLREVLAACDFPALKRFRLVCKRWRKVADRNMQVLRPCKAKLHTLTIQFPSVRQLDLSGCQNVRNRNLSILARSALRLRLDSLSIGHASSYAYGKPRITNQALVSIAELRGLRRLALSDCSAITNNGMTVLTALSLLRHLAVNRCPRISDKGLAIVQQLPDLASINVYGCVKITDKLLLVLRGLTKLQALHLGFTRVTDAGVGALAQLPSLTRLIFYGEDISNASLTALAQLSRLRSLGLSNCYELVGGAISRTLAALPHLTHLNIQNCDFSDDNLAVLVRDLPRLARLELQGGNGVTGRGCRRLAGASSLRSLALENCSELCMNAIDQMNAISLLTQLTQLQVLGSHMVPPLMAALTHLPHLADLNLSEFDLTQSILHDTVPQPAALAALASCTGLRRLDLSHVNLREEQVRALMGALPLLEELCLYGCPLSDECLARLMAAHPRVEVHKSVRHKRPNYPALVHPLEIFQH